MTTMHNTKSLQEGRAYDSRCSLRVGEFVRHALAVLTVLTSSIAQSTVAFAEVCDKEVGESWTPANGVVWLLNPREPQLVSYGILAAGLILIVMIQRRWTGYVAAILPLIFVWISVEDFLLGDGVFEASLKEGCRSKITTIFDLIAMLISALGFIWLAHRFSRIRTAQ